MEEILHADIFFFVTTIVVVLFAIMGTVAFIFLIVAAKNIKDLSKTLKEGGEKVVQDVTDETGALRKNLQKYGKEAVKIGVYVIGGYVKKKIKSKRKKNTSHKKDE